jgi:spore coat polysaccharide biosynthesis protein SpsF (cytidylyltransferase family)
MKVAAVVLARLDSSRLPRKVLRVVAGRALIDYVFAACRGADVDVIVLATTDRIVDDQLAAHATTAGVRVFRGGVDDVAGRFLGALESVGADAAIRVNGDSPLHRSTLLAEGVASWRTEPIDVVTNVPGRTWPFGFSVEVVAAQAMRRACETMTSPAHREHVTKRFYDNDGFHLRQLQPGPEGGAGLQLAVDDADDLARFAWIVEQAGERLSALTPTELISLARAFPGSEGRHV